jgi:hypothetical protein
LTLPGDSFLRQPDTAGVALPTILIAGKEYPVVALADSEGHVLGTPFAYLLYMGPRAMTATAVDYFDLFNAAGSGVKLRVRGLWPIIDMPAAAAFTRSFTFDIFRTSAVGTGGSPHTYAAAAKPGAGAVNIAPLAPANPALPAQVTARGVPSGGATASVFLFDMPLYAEETNPATGLAQGINFIPELAQDQPLEIPAGAGLKVRQNTAAAGLTVGFLLAFAVV